ncbi:MAG: hypothetical protein AAF431_12670 [Pseudomonadota bacterium]
MKESTNVKVWLTCPTEDAKQLRLAIGDAGIGTIGNYTHCCFVVEGKGFAKPNEDANPHIGKAGTIEEIEEVSLEFVCARSQLETLRSVIAEHHPYDEVAMDIFPLLEF